MLAGIERSRARVEQVLAAADARLERARSAVATAAAPGFRTDELQASLDRAVADYEAGRTAVGEHRLGAAEPTLERADATLVQVAEWGAGIADRQRDLIARHAAAQQRASATATAVASATAIVQTLRDGYARAVWDPVDAAPVDSADAVEEARSHLDATVAAVRTVEADLRSAEAEYEGAADEATRSLQAASAFATQHADDVDDAHLPALDRARSVLDDAVATATAPRPDPLAALHRLREVDATTDAVLRTARSEKETRDAARRAARSRIGDAHRSLDQALARSGFGMFGWSARVKSQIESAKAQLRSASDVVDTDPERAQRMAASAERTGRTILEEARRRNQDNSGGGGGGGSSSFGGGGGGSSRW